MMYLPLFNKMNNVSEFELFAQKYQECSGFNVDMDYFTSNQVFGIYHKKQLIGGFVLGQGAALRTVEVFAGEESRAALYQQIQAAGVPTEMCCFWMDAAYRKHTVLNFFIWGCVAYALQVYGTPLLVFGTCSARLARLYSSASESMVIHTDFIHQKQTFVFMGPRKYCLLGVWQILSYKTKRLLNMAFGSKINAIRRVYA